jgi:sorting and assembly machinery component 37
MYSPTSLDIALFANLALVLDPALPDPLLANFIRAELPSLSAHHDRVLASLWPRGWDSVRRVTVGTAPAPSLGERVRSFLPSWAGGPSSTASRKASEEPGEQTSKDAARRLARGRWMWFLAVPFTVVVYLLASGVVEIDFSGEECEEEEEEAFELVYDDEGFLTLPVEDDEDEDEDEDED